MGEVVIKGLKQIRYVNAGTVEFLLDKNKNFYFMEINARIQVEHPVTEMVTSIDLVKEQIKIASGEKLNIKQEKVNFNGHAIECRINAEDPDNKFMPCPGRIVTYHAPGGWGTRVESHAYVGYDIPSYYDSMIAKLITHGKNRQEAIYTMQRALDEFIIEPVKTTLPFHKRVFSDQVFIEGRVHTGYVDKLLGEPES